MSSLFTVYAAHENQTIVVKTTAELDSALSTLHQGGGGTILLDGTAGPFELNAEQLDGDAPILVRALDPKVLPVIEKIKVVDSSFLTVTEAKIDRSAIVQSDPEYVHDVTISRSHHIELVGNQMIGTADGYLSEGSAAQQGASLAIVRDSAHVTFSHNEISDYYHGVTYREVSDSRFVANDVSGIQGDGFRGVGVQNVQITDNHMHDFYGSTQDLNHSDMIQIWTNGAQSVTSDLTISGNILDSGSGMATQSILIGNTAVGHGGPANTLPLNIVITDNVIHNGAANGIRVGHVDGLQIRNNTLLWNTATGTQTTAEDPVISREPGITVMGTLNTVIADNVTSRVSVDGVHRDAGNFILDYTDRDDPNYVHTHINNLSGQGDLDLRDLGFKSESAANGQFGATLSWRAEPDTLEAVITTDESFGNRQARLLSASESFVTGDPDQASYVWRFDDGTELSGQHVVAVFATRGTYDVTLQVTLENGASDTISRLVSVRSNDIIALDFNDGVRDVSDAGATFSYQGSDKSVLVDGAEGQGFRLTGSTLIQIDRDNDQLFGLRSFSLDLDYQPGSAREYGTLMRLPGTMDLFITTTGALRFRLTTDQGAFEVLTGDGVMKTTDWLSIGVSYDDARGQLQLFINDQLVGQTSAAGITSSGAQYPMYIGNPWSESVRGVIDNFEMTTEPRGGWVEELPGGAVDGALDTAVFDVVGFDDRAKNPQAPDDEAPVLIEAAPGSVYSLRESGLTIPREADFLHNRTDFRIELQLETLKSGQEGAFLHLHKSLLAQVDAHGHVLFTLTTSDGVFDLRSAVPLFATAARHDLAFSYDAQSGLVQIEADNVVVAQTTATGVTADAVYWGLVLGHGWQQPLEAEIQGFRFLNGQALDPVTTDTDTISSLGWQASTLLRFEGAVHDVLDASTVFYDLPSAPGYVDGPTGQAFQLSTGGNITFGRGEIALNAVDGFVINFDFQRESDTQSGRVMHLHEVMDTVIDADGFVYFTLQTDAGTHKLVSDAAVFGDTDWHNVQIAYDGDAEILSLAVDDVVVAATQASGTTAEASYWGATIGSAWGESISGNIDNVAFGDEMTLAMIDDALLY